MKLPGGFYLMRIIFDPRRWALKKVSTASGPWLTRWMVSANALASPASGPVLLGMGPSARCWRSSCWSVEEFPRRIEAGAVFVPAR